MVDRKPAAPCDRKWPKPLTEKVSTSIAECSSHHYSSHYRNLSSTHWLLSSLHFLLIIISLGIGDFPFQCPADQQALTGEAPRARSSKVLRNVP